MRISWNKLVLDGEVAHVPKMANKFTFSFAIISLKATFKTIW